MMTVEVGVAVAVVTLVLSITTFFIGRQNGAKQQGVKEGKLEATVMTELRHIGAGVNRIEASQARLANEQKEDRERLIRVEESAKQAHKRIDTLGVPHSGVLG